MATTVKLPDEFIQEARKYAEIFSRSLPKQIEHWSKIGRIAEDNPDLPYEFIKQILMGLDDISSEDITEFKFNDKNSTN
jgi:ParD-like antitoxin of type II bacterial toxin-antitoxin system